MSNETREISWLGEMLRLPQIACCSRSTSDTLTAPLSLFAANLPKFVFAPIPLFSSHVNQAWLARCAFCCAQLRSDNSYRRMAIGVDLARWTTASLSVPRIFSDADMVRFCVRGVHR
jgi:hypothetical protein